MKSRWMLHKDRYVMYLDYADFGNKLEELRAEVIEADGLILKEKPNSVAVLIDLRNTVASGGVVKMFKESSVITTPFIRRHALVGVTGIKRYLAEKVALLNRRPMRLFDTPEQALDWLVSDGGGLEGGDIIGASPTE